MTEQLSDLRKTLQDTNDHFKKEEEFMKRNKQKS